MHVLRFTIRHHHLAGSRKRGSKEALLPVAVKAERVPQITDACHAVLITVIDHTRQLPRTEPHAERFLHQHRLRSLAPVAHVEVEFHAGKGQSVHVDIQFAVIEGIVGRCLGLHPDHVLRSVVDVFRHRHRELVVVELLLVQQEVAILHHVHDQSLYGATHHLHAQSVSLLLTQQSATLHDSHSVARRASGVRRLIQILHALSHVDIVLALHGRLAVESLQQFGHSAVVLGNLADGYIHQFARILVHHHDLPQLDGGRYHSYLQPLRLSIHHAYQSCLISQMRYAYALWLFIQFQREGTVLVGYYAYLPCRYAHLPQRSSGLIVQHLSTDHHLLCHHSQRSQHHDHYTQSFHLRFGFGFDAKIQKNRQYAKNIRKFK